MDPSVDTKLVLSIHRSFHSHPHLLPRRAPTSSPTSLPPSSEMLPRTWSIFHVGEEGGEAPKTGEAVGAAIGRLESSKGTCQRLEGLRILIQNSGRRSNVAEITMNCGSDTVISRRGDQGFCSEECRQDQILLDERTEAEASARGTMKPPLRRPAAANKVQESDRRRRIVAAA
ncbi:PPR repeat [Musa troglodytarum]|uniref:PPR repeat n=1 Tax=Musa troglodytarum TaxID=320322 RepID=A0A9E7FPI3_9LILI|nr:PPR repeat [Musa troglodytarum]